MTKDCDIEQAADEVMEQSPITDGLICVFITMLLGFVTFSLVGAYLFSQTNDK